MKIDFRDFQANSEKRNFLYGRIESKSYLDDDIAIQMDTLKFMSKKIKESYKSGSDIVQEREAVRSYIYKFLRYDIVEPTFNDFFIPRTLEYLNKNEDVLKNAVEEFIMEHKDCNKILKQAHNNSTENLMENVEAIIAVLMENLSTFRYVRSRKFKDIQHKIKTKALKESDINDVQLYVGKLIRESAKKSREEFYKEIKRHPEKVYKKLVNNMNTIFSVNTPEKSEKNINAFLSKENFMSQFKDKKLSEETVKVNDFINDPFYGTNSENDALVFLSEFLGSLSDTSIKNLYSILQQSKKNENDKNLIIDLIKSRVELNKNRELKKLLSNRIVKLLEFQDNIGWLEKYNEKNNERLEFVGLNGLTISKEELLKTLSSEDFTTETGVALSTFYVNRVAKIVPAFLRASFILDKNGLFEKLYENPDLNLEDFDLSQEKVRENMAEYDGLSDVIIQKCLKKEKGQYNEEILTVDVQKLGQYQVFYDKRYGNWENDFKNVVSTYNYKKFFYTIKDFSLSSLIYTVLTNSKNKTINWGYVKIDENKDKDKILLGFDIQQLNTALFTHIGKQYLINAVRNITGQNIIPVYEGARDFNVLSKGKRMTTAVLYPITSKQRKYLNKMESSRNTFVKHLIWIQKNKLKPDWVNIPGSRLYDIEKNEVFENKENKKVQNQLDIKER